MSMHLHVILQARECIRQCYLDPHLLDLDLETEYPVDESSLGMLHVLQVLQAHLPNPTHPSLTLSFDWYGPAVSCSNPIVRMLLYTSSHLQDLYSPGQELKRTEPMRPFIQISARSKHFLMCG
jgi:hypothetical protein